LSAFDNPLDGADTFGLFSTKKQTPRKPRKPINNEEQRNQIALFSWAKSKLTLRHYPLFRKLLFSVPNGGLRSKKTAGDIKKEGAESGVSDILFLVPAHGYPYLCIEMKSSTGRQSDNQKDFEAEVDEVGGLYQIAYSKEEAEKILRWYYSGIKL